MGVVDDNGADRARIEVLERQLDEMRRQVAELRMQVHGPAAAAAPTPTRPSGSGPVEDADAGPRPVSRRGLIAGAAGAVAAGAALAVGSATPAAANGQGQSLTLGDFTNSATTTTGLHATSVDPVLMITSYGTTTGNAAQFYVHDAGNTSAVTHHETAGNGPAAEFVNQNSANTAPTVSVQTDGTGPAGSFVASSSGNTANALGVLTNGSGNAFSASAKGGNAAFLSATGANAALFVTMSGTGYASFVNHSSTTSTNPALFVQTTSPSPAIRAKGPRTNLNLWPRSVAGAPTADAVAHGAGDLVEDSTGTLWICVAGGTPGTWRKLAGPTTAGALHVLPSPVRIYDSRPGTSPAVGSKTRLSGNVARTVDLTVNSSGVPAGATAAMVTILIVNASPGNANFTLWANGVTRPSSNTMVWGGSVGRFSSLAVTALDSTGKAQVLSSIGTDVVLDVVGYFR